MTYGQVIFILFVVLIGYYGFLIFMDIQHLKAAEAAAQENQSEEEIDITDEARSFQPQQVIRDDKKKEEEKKQGMKMIPTRINSRQHLMSNRMRMLLLKVVKMFPIRKHQQLPNNQIFLFRQRILPLKQYHRLKLLSLIIKKKYPLPKLLIKMKLKILPMRMPKQPHRKLELLPDPTSHRATGNPS